MEYHVEWVDVSQFIRSGQAPVFMLTRQKAHENSKAWAGPSEIARLGEHWVPQGPVLGGVTWTLTKQGDFVRIPVSAYKTQRALSSIWGLGLQIGMAATDELRKHTGDVPIRAVLVLGRECTDLAVDPITGAATGDDSFRCYVGIALQTK
jgi:hypothetical protein